MSETKGHWIVKTIPEAKWDRVRFYCSDCNEWQTYGETPYCPYCGKEKDLNGKSERSITVSIKGGEENNK